MDICTDIRTYRWTYVQTYGHIDGHMHRHTDLQMDICTDILKTSFYEELKIFASLPILPFLKAVYVLLKRKRYLRYVLSFLIVSTYLILSNYNINAARIFSYSTLSIGLITLGIPHGALDHLLLKTKDLLPIIC